MKNVFGIIGALLFAAAVAVGYFCDFNGDVIVEIGLAAFALTSLIVGAIKAGKEKNLATWKTVVIIALAVIGGVLCCIGGLAQNIFASISGAVLALLAVIFGLVFAKKQ